MIMRKAILFLTITMITFIACNESNRQQASEEPSVRELSNEDVIKYLSLGDSITNQAQATLLQNVSAAIKEGGTDYAVEFCNTRAIPLTDSVGGQYTVSLQRLSDKNRNPLNALEKDADKAAWEKIVSENKHLVQQDENGVVYYYKPIMIGMETCLKCHGDKDQIPVSTQKIISEKYTADKAIAYQMGDLRGMWKVGFTD